MPKTPEWDEDFYKSIVEKTAEVVKVCRPDGTLTYANPAFEEAYGWEVERVLGTNIMEYVHEGDIDRIARETEAALENSVENSGPVSNRAVYCFRCADGTYRVMEALGTYLMDDENIGGVVLFTRAVSSPKS
ncbi:MAG: PAS domain S-box protein [Rubrobacter sp.]|nr:PAS domain S-box protein [Rubrobacter sp.]